VVSICTTRATPSAFGLAQLAFAAVGAGAGAAAAGAGAGAGAAAGAGGGVVRCGIRACDQALVKAQTEMALAAKNVALIRIANTPERKISRVRSVGRQRSPQL